MSPLLLNAPPSSAHCCPREDAEASPEASSTALEAARWQEPLSKPCLLLVPLGSPEPLTVCCALGGCGARQLLLSTPRVRGYMSLQGDSFYLPKPGRDWM